MKKNSFYAQIIEKNKEKLLAEGNSLEDIKSFKKKKPALVFGKRKRI